MTAVLTSCSSCFRNVWARENTQQVCLKEGGEEKEVVLCQYLNIGIG